MDNYVTESKVEATINNISSQSFCLISITFAPTNVSVFLLGLIFLGLQKKIAGFFKETIFSRIYPDSNVYSQH
jgi:hypothetical protein